MDKQTENAAGGGNIVYLPIERLHPHPNNPRQQLGDLTELADSIKANGVYQNLTVVMDGERAGRSLENCDYIIVIGHRRHAAAKLAGLTELPCVIAAMTQKEQVQTMLLENMQRSDLTPYEQAQGFQMMIDLGDTVEEIAEKSGFSKSTVYSRVKLLELDEKKFKKGEARGATLRDYLELSKVQDLDARNKVLDSIGTPDFNIRLKNALEDQKFKKYLAEIIEAVKAADWCREKTDENCSWDGSYRHCVSYGKYNQKELACPEDAGTVDYIYEIRSDSVVIYREKTEEEKKKTVSPEERRWEKLSRDLDKNEKELKRMSRIHKETRMEFVKNFTAISSSEMDIEAFAARAMIAEGYRADLDVLSDLLGIPVEKKKNSYDRCLKPEEWDRELFNRPLFALLCTAYSRLEYGDKVYFGTTWDTKLGMSLVKHTPNPQLDLIYSGLGSLGYEMSEEETQMQKGTHPLFQKVRELVKAYQKDIAAGKKKGSK